MALDPYLTTLLADGARPFQYRSRVRALLGVPEDEGPGLVAGPMSAAVFAGAAGLREVDVSGALWQERGALAEPHAG
ncbi:hypothetical protein, partial [Streptomyces sp. NPDC056512]|uniref:hypothetical protein n=1 Tax=Streptomyces sp. NPDC056512 TaxID=3345846 RepID=UPI003679314A